LQHWRRALFSTGLAADVGQAQLGSCGIRVHASLRLESQGHLNMWLCPQNDLMPVVEIRDADASFGALNMPSVPIPSCFHYTRYVIAWFQYG